MDVQKTKVMLNILESLGLKEFEDYQVNEKTINITLDINKLVYYLNSSEHDIQHVYGKTIEWKMLCDLYKTILFNGR